MARRRNHSRKPRPRIMFGVDPLIRRKLFEYALNLLPEFPVKDCYVEFVRSLTGSEVFLKRIRETRPKTGRTKKDIELEELLDSPVAKYLQKLPVEKAREVMETEIKAAMPKSPNSRLKRRLKALGELMGLSKHEIEVLCLAYCYTHSHAFEQLCDLCGHSSYTEFVALATRIPMQAAWDAVSRQGRLYSAGLLTHGCPPAVAIPSDSVRTYLAGIEEATFAQRFCRPDAGDAFPLSTFTVPPERLDIVRKLLLSGKPAHILLHGVAGTGKTEFTRAVTREMGRQAFFVRQGDSEARPDRSSRRLALSAASATVDPQTGVLIVDEADDFLNTSNFFTGSPNHGDKGWINSFMDSYKGTVVWITNEVAGIPESTMRRFSYSLRFDRFSRQERENVWKNLVREHPLQQFISDATIQELALRYEVNAAGIASALSAAPSILGNGHGGETAVKAVLKELLDRHAEATGAKRTQSINNLTDKYDLGAVRTDGDTDLVVRSVCSFSSQLQAEQAPDSLSMNLLLWGEPGTGKTEFAKYLADQAGMRLLVRRASDILSMWVGGTEANIRRSFEEAKKEKAMLLLDEADSFFIDRSSAQRSWETSQTNELLTQMENHGGILVCCTNLLTHLDSAVMRRFAWKLRFDAPAADGRLALYRQYFSDVGEMNPVQTKRVQNLASLTAGDIRAVWQKLQFVLSDSSHEDVIRALQEEKSFRKDGGSSIGFSAVA